MADPRKVPDLKTDLQLGDAALETIRHAALVREREPLIARQAANLAAKVDRIVILMLENRSYDHMLGWVGRRGGGLTGNEFCPLVAPKMGAPPVPLPVDPKAPGRPFVTGETRLPISPSHAGRATLREINGGNMQGFLQEFGKERKVEIQLRGEIGGADGRVMPMATYSAESLAAYAHLVRHEVTCSSWHASVPAGTWPNRMYLYSGSCGGQLGNGNVVIRDKVFDTFMPKYLIVDRLDQAAPPVTWSVYTHNITWMRLYPDRQKGFMKNTKPFRQLKRDCEKGGDSLAQVVFVEPRHTIDALGLGANRTRSDDLAPANLVDGQQLVADVYRALAALPLAERQRTMLVVTYDEHGGFYDHVSPPPTIGKNVDEDADFEKDGVHVPAFERYGVRVPAFVCSAFAPAGQFSSQLFPNDIVFDHASLHATLHRRFLPGVRFPSRRVEVANTLGALLTRDVARIPFPIDDLPTDFGIGRGARQEERAERREDRRDDRQDNRAERREDRQDDREARRDDRQDDRAERREDRQDDRAVRREDDDGLAEWIRSLGEPDGG